MKGNRKLVCSVLFLLFAINLIMFYTVYGFHYLTDTQENNNKNSSFFPDRAFQYTLTVQPCGDGGSGAGQGPYPK